jgi:hypothetical protein
MIYDCNKNWYVFSCYSQTAVRGFRVSGLNPSAPSHRSRDSVGFQQLPVYDFEQLQGIRQQK